MESQHKYLECEKQWVYRLLMVVAGFYGGYAMVVRGGAFSNAQTGNVALMALALGNGNWRGAAYYLIPISAYAAGALVSELLPKKLRRKIFMRWDTLLTLFELVMVAAMGFIPASAPHQICQVIINFICSMQYNTFRQAEGVSQATTFCTNHIRQIGLSLAGGFSRKKSWSETGRRIWIHGSMILCFIVGVAAAAVACRFLGAYAIWCNLLPLAILFADLLHADLTTEKNLLEITPGGH